MMARRCDQDPCARRANCWPWSHHRASRGTRRRRHRPRLPYPGLSAFTTQDAGRFFGRERATAALVERLFRRVGEGPLLLVAPRARASRPCSTPVWCPPSGGPAASRWPAPTAGPSSPSPPPRTRWRSCWNAPPRCSAATSASPPPGWASGPRPLLTAVRARAGHPSGRAPAATDRHPARPARRPVRGAVHPLRRRDRTAHLRPPAVRAGRPRAPSPGHDPADRRPRRPRRLLPAAVSTRPNSPPSSPTASSSCRR